MEEIEEYDDNGNVIYHKSSDGVEEWYKYDAYGEKKNITKEEYDYIYFFRKENIDKIAKKGFDDLGFDENLNEKSSLSPFTKLCRKIDTFLSNLFS